MYVRKKVHSNFLGNKFYMTYKLIALDIDGTIKNFNREITKITQESLDTVRDSGALVTLATGRSFNSAILATRSLKLEAPIISFQGAHIGDPITSQVIWHMPLTEKMTLDTLAYLENWPGEILVFIKNKIYVKTITQWTESYIDRTETEIVKVNELNSVANKKPTRIVLVADNNAIADIEKQLIDVFQDMLHVTRSLPNFCEILHPFSGKHKALEVICSRLGISRESVLAFGNGYNDVHMLKWAGLGVAVGGSVPEVINSADVVCGTVDTDGPATLLKQFLDKGLIG